MKKLFDDEIELPMDEAFYDALHDKIMAKVEETSIKPKAWHQAPTQYLRDHWRGWLYSGASVASILVLLLGLGRIAGVGESHSAQVAKNEDSIIANSIENTDEFARILAAAQDEDEFFMDIAQTSFDDLSVRGLEQTISTE